MHKMQDIGVSVFNVTIETFRLRLQHQGPVTLSQQLETPGVKSIQLNQGSLFNGPSDISSFQVSSKRCFHLIGICDHSRLLKLLVEMSENRKKTITCKVNVNATRNNKRHSQEFKPFISQQLTWANKTRISCLCPQKNATDWKLCSRHKATSIVSPQRRMTQ